MVISNYLPKCSLAGAALALSGFQSASFPVNASCGEVNVFYTGFTAYHPFVLDQGSNPVDVDHRLGNGTANLVKAGFNVRGPEQPVSNIADRMEGTNWGVDVQSFGIRGYANGTATRRFEDNLYQFQQSALLTPTVFNWGPDSFAEAVTRRIPLKEDCADKPGRLIAYKEVCDPSVCEKVTVILDGDMEKLLEGIE